MTAETALLKRLRELLRERSVTRGDFVLASGKRSTYYIDARPTTMSGEGLTVIGALGLARLQARGWAPRAVGGLTLGADPVAYAIAAIRGGGGTVLGVLAVVDREEGGRASLEALGLAVDALVSASELL